MGTNMKLRNKAVSVATGLALCFAASSAQAQNTVNTAVDWSTGSPRWTSDDGQFQFKLRGRLMADAYSIDADFGGTARDASYSGFGTRRARLGVDGKFNEVFKFRAEATFLGSAATWEDIYLEYAPNGMSVFVGNNYVNTTLDGLTSSTVHLTNERSLVTAAFGRASRLMGVNVRKYADNWQVTAGFYGDSINNSESNNVTETRVGELRGSYAFSAARGNIAHIGASVRYRDRNQGGALSYSARPVQTNYGTAFLNTGSIGQKDTTYGIEGLFSKGPFTAIAEYQILEAKTLTEDLSFGGGYVELSYFLTGETRGYSATSGTLSGVKPNSPLQEGGYGAWAIVGRYDKLDLSDGTLGRAISPVAAWRTAGGEADAYSLGVLWQPTDFVIFRATYGYTDFKNTQGIDSAAATQITGNGDAQTFTIRTQFSF